ncbi:MAG: PAS domain S-box protein, partial [Nitrosospira sp.]
MYKRIITLVVIGFGLLLALGLATNYFLYQKLQQRVDEAIAEKLLLNQTRVPVRIAQLAHMLMVQTVGDFLIDPSPGEAFDNRRRQEQNAQKDATAKIRNAFAATQNPELQNIGQKLIKHHGQVTVRWGNEVIRLATIDLKAAQGSYWQNFLPAQAEGMTLLDEALRISSEELDHFHARSNESTVQAQFIFGASIILSACLGLGIAFFLGQTVVRLTRLTEKTAKEHKDMMDHSLDVFCSINDAGRFIRVSSACEQNWGYTADELVGQPYIALVHPDDVEQTLQAQATIMTGESIRDFDNRYIHKDGSTVHNRWSVQWLSDKRQLICVAHDMTQVDRSIQVLQASEERTRLILATGHDAFVGLDADGNIIDWNQQAQTTFGWAEEEARGKAFQDLIVSPPFRAQYRGIIEQLKSDSKTHTTNQRIELSALHRDGHELPIEFSISLLCRGDTFMFSAFLRDITERRKWETQLSQAKETAEAATSAKSAFLANMSHEIRTPMNGVIGLAALMLKTPLSPQQLEFMTLIKSSADSLLRLLNDILDFSKMEANKLELVAIQFDIRELLGDTLKAFSALANEKGLELAYRVAPEVPLLMLGDPGRLAQIIVNLTGNALKFTEQGEVTVRVTQESHTPDKAILRFSIVDTGIGMSTKQQGHIFNGFEQGDSSTTRRYGGTGLGLTIAAQLVKMMGGTIWVESEPGKGTTFHFTVRLAIPEKQSVPVQRLPGIVNKMPVLVVDDNITHRQILADILNSWSMQPTLTKGGREGLAEMQRMAALGTSFPLVLLDSRMPEFDGFELAQCIKDTPALAGTTIMMLSSSDASDEIERCKALSITHFLRKPIKQSELFNAITSAMSIECNIDSSSAYVTNPQSAISNPARLLKVLIAEDHPINQKVVVEIL